MKTIIVNNAVVNKQGILISTDSVQRVKPTSIYTSNKIQR